MTHSQCLDYHLFNQTIRCTHHALTLKLTDASALLGKQRAKYTLYPVWQVEKYKLLFILWRTKKKKNMLIPQLTRFVFWGRGRRGGGGGGGGGLHRWVNWTLTSPMINLEKGKQHWPCLLTLQQFPVSVDLAVQTDLDVQQVRVLLHLLLKSQPQLSNFIILLGQAHAELLTLTSHLVLQVADT